MKRWLVLPCTGLLFVLLLLTLAAPPGARGETNDFFIISNADATNTLSMTSTGTTFSIEDRVMLEHANASKNFSIVPPLPAFRNLLAVVEDRIVIEYANAARFFPLTRPSQALIDLLQSVEDRFVLQYANASKTFALGYPVEMIGDTTPPAVVSVSSSPSGGSILVTLTSSEYALAELKYGSSPGSYPSSLGDDLYRTTHRFLVPAPQAGETTYFRVVLTDRSGNTFTSQEYTLVAFRLQYLPFLLRR
jgi:hypothetical protein